jgi:hypothetical protein
MNEENGLRGATAYADAVRASGERHVAAIESDRGGFAPRGFEVDGTAQQMARLNAWLPLLAPMGAGSLIEGSGGADISPLKEFGALTIGLVPEAHRYFDYHHSANDTFDKVNERELEMGAAAMAMLAYLLANE